ncbi:hypothetical protein RCG19_13375 [Neobacillus sp. OS1-2]|uniref:hypothetical protein n=1 Tax=Neobacillus sp. OS1-2 TaxID=3070680 RepID=UPI0027E144B5|nr:hypothetical protein [Neobacillus sp. OS1-2]WML38214.1 hypothetical protein RCG19_13375 [Neobacillus sp. OS1-2]
MKRNILIGLGLVAILSIPQVRTSLVDTMIGQMIIQIPLLALAGYFLGSGFRKDDSEYNSLGIPGLLIVLFASIYWLLPRSLDAALNSSVFEILKYVTVPLLIGLPLAWSWGKLPGTVKGVVWANVISMLFVMGWLYANAPIRLCNNYLIGQQNQLGTTLMVLSLLCLLAFFCKVFFIGIKSE